MPSSPAGVDSPTAPRKAATSSAPWRKLGEVRGDHALVEAVQRHPAACVVHIGQKIGEHADGIARGPAIDAGMQIARRPGYGDLGERKPAQKGGDGWRVGIQLPGVADEANVGLQFLSVVIREEGEARASGLLFAFEKDGHVDRQASMHGKPGAASLEEGHHLPLIVGGAAGDDDLARLRILREARREGRGGPLLQGIGRLHVVVSVEQHARRRI